MRQDIHELTINTPGPGLHEFTAAVLDWVEQTGIETGLLTVFVRHTSASLVIQENAAPAARRDLERYFARIAPESRDYEHDDEGPDDMPAHLRSALTATSLSIPVSAAGRCSARGREFIYSSTAARPIGAWWRCILLERETPRRGQAASSSASRP